MILTGGTGAVGSRLVPRLLEAGWSLFLLSRTPPKEEHPDLTWEKVDLLKISKLPNLPKEADVILHLVNLSKQDPEQDLRVSVWLAEFAIKQKILHYFYSSSIRVYGDSRGTISEDTPPTPNPRDPYGVSKLRIENRLRSVLYDDDVQLRILRLGHVINSENIQEVAQPPSLLRRVLWSKAFPHYVNVEDVLDAILFLVNNRETLKNGVYNITREMGAELTFQTVYNKFFQGEFSTPGITVPLGVLSLLYRNRSESFTAFAGRIVEQNLQKENWEYSGDPISKLQEKLAR